MKKTIRIFFLLCLFISIKVPAQSFISTIDYSNLNYFLTQPSVVNINEDMTVVIGSVSQDLTISNSSTEIVVFALDRNGNKIWSKKIYPLEETGYFASAAKYDESEERIVITGYSSGGIEVKDLLLCKLDLQGNVTDIKTYNNSRLYGLDIEVSSDSYMITGLKNDYNQKKSGLVININKTNLNPNWVKLYESNGTNQSYDSFGDILKVQSHPSGSELFFLTGSGEAPSGESIIVNDLIDINGNSLWSQPSAYKSTSNYPGVGKAALYSEQSNRFYVFGSFNVENDLSPIILDGITGNFIGSEYMHFHNYFLTGIEWFDKSNEKIIISTYDIEGIHGSNKHRFIVFDFGSMNLEIYEFDNFIDPNYMKSINYNDITKVVTQSANPFNYENFYTPKAFTLSQDKKSFYALSPYDTDFNYFKIDEKLLFEGCKTSSIHNFTIDPGHVSYNHIITYDSSVEVIEPEYSIEKFSPLIYDYCDPYDITKFTKNNNLLNIKNRLNNVGIEIYPNPTKNKVTITGLNNLENLRKVEVYNINGKRVLNQDLSKTLSQKEIDLSKLQSGVYFIKVLSKENTTLLDSKIVKE